MIPLLGRESVRALDREAIESFGVPGVVLMENAGAGATRVLLDQFGGAAARAVLVGGTGQNGGDAWVVARQLLTRGFVPRCVLVGDPDKVRGDARLNLDALRALGIEPVVCGAGELHMLEELLARSELVVDGLFGTGLDRDIEGLHAQAITLLNACGKDILALDLPSGVDADTGQVRGAAVRARCTVTFAAQKPGLHQFPGAELAGKLHCVPIGVPASRPSSWGLIEASDVAREVPRRSGNAHKGTNGRVVVLAGSAGKTGAAMLSALSALRAGAGLVTIVTDAETQRSLDHKVVEVMTHALSDAAPAAEAIAFARQQDTALLGPGFGLTPERRALALELARQLPVPCVLDADALTAIGSSVSLLRAAAAPRVLTPHPGEAARLLACAVSDVERDRYQQALRLAEASQQVVVLKGGRTVVASPGGSVRVCASGTPALGTAGTGDVLAGLIAALAVSLPPFTAAWVGVELHARAGTLAARSDRGLLASEVTGFLAAALEDCRRVAQE
jgi:hydroxyethylthiazole kinase-like uncharacterized protein yjeF